MRAASAFLSALLIVGCAGAPAKVAVRTVQTVGVVCGETVRGAAKGAGVGTAAGFYVGCPSGPPACLGAMAVGFAGGAIIGSAQGFDAGMRRARDLWREPGPAGATSDAYL